MTLERPQTQSGPGSPPRPVLRPRYTAQAGPVYARYAGFVSRLMAMVGDILIIGAILAVSGIAADFFVRTSGVVPIVDVLAERVPWITPIRAFVNSPGFSLLAVLITSFAYFAFFYSFGGATPGKYTMGLRVVTTDGRRLRPAQASLRALAYAPSALALYLGFFAVLADDRRRGWHDRIARTAVIYKWQARPDEAFVREIADELD